MNPRRKVNKARKMYSLDPAIVDLLEQVAGRFYGGNASAAIEEAVQRLARQHGVVALSAAMRRRKHRMATAEEDQAGRLMAPEEVFWSLLEWGRDTFGNDFFQGTYAVDPERRPNGAMIWTFTFDIAAYERVRGASQATASPAEGEGEEEEQPDVQEDADVAN